MKTDVAMMRDNDIWEIDRYSFLKHWKKGKKIIYLSNFDGWVGVKGESIEEPSEYEFDSEDEAVEWLIK